MRTAFSVVLIFVAFVVSLAQVRQPPLPPPQVLANGKVVDGAGKPVAIARVAGTLVSEGSQNSYNTTSDGNGDFVIAVRNTITYQSVARFSAWAPGFSSADRMTTPPMGDPAYKDLMLVLRPAVDFAVNVTDTAGQPVAGATVVIPRITLGDRPEDKTLTTDQKGTAMLLQVNDQSRLTFEVSADGYLKTTALAENLTKKSLKVALSKGGTFTCQLVDMQTGKPLSNVAVDLPYLNHAAYKTDENGIFHATNVPFGTVLVAMPNSGYTHDWDHAQGGFRTDFPAGSAEAVHKLAVRHDYLIEGDVVDAAKQPLAGVEIYLSPADIRVLMDSLGAQTKTDAKGHFRYDGFSVDHFTVTTAGEYRCDPVECRYSELHGPITIVAERVKKAGP